MFAIPEQFSAASNASFESQLALINNLTAKTFEGVEKVIELNLSAAKTSLEESSAAAKQFLSAKDPQAWLSLATAQAQPSAEKALAFGRELAGITSSIQAEFTKVAETQIAETSRKMLELLEQVTKNAPAGSENAVTLLETAIGNASAGYEQLTKTTKQAVETFEANVNNAVTQFTQPVTATVKAAAPRAAKK